MIIVGHTRYKAAQKLGLDNVPVRVVTDLTLEQIRAYRIADNKTAELADWNYDLLPLELSQFGSAGFDLQLLGFSADELTGLLDPGVKDGLTDPDDIPEPPDSSRTGENVLDLFGGSGSTLIGCEQTGRNAFLMEMDPLYCDVIVQRFESFSGTKAERIAGAAMRRAG